MKAWRWWLALAALSLGADEAAAIVGAADDGAPYRDRVVMILNRGPEGSGFCTGLVLAPRIVLTAAHCLRSPKDMLALYRDEANNPVTLNIVRSEQHPGYRGDAVRRRVKSLDIGLVLLETPLPGRFQPSVIANRGAAVGETVEVAGFGLGREGDAHSGGTLRAASLIVSEPASRVVLWAGDPRSTGLGACSGDSGAPIFASDGSALALVAWTKGPKGRECGSITQGPLLAPQRAWIDGVISVFSP